MRSIRSPLAHGTFNCGSAAVAVYGILLNPEVLSSLDTPSGFLRLHISVCVYINTIYIYKDIYMDIHNIHIIYIYIRM